MKPIHRQFAEVFQYIKKMDDLIKEKNELIREYVRQTGHLPPTDEHPHLLDDLQPDPMLADLGWALEELNDYLKNRKEKPVEFYLVELFMNPKMQGFVDHICEKKGLSEEGFKFLVARKIKKDYDNEPEKYEELFAWLQKGIDEGWVSFSKADEP